MTALQDGVRPEISLIIPCLNEEECLPHVLDEIHSSFDQSGLSFEIVLADNGSTDRSAAIARERGARVVAVHERGYGAALQGGINAARGAIGVMGDADGSYRFGDAIAMVDPIRRGADLVMGNRFRGGIAPGAMPWLHRYLGNPVLSWLGRVLFRVPVGDFHCGLRAFNLERIRSLGLKSPGMEFASEMVVLAQKAHFSIEETPVRLEPDVRSRPPHLKTWRDGWRHLRFLFSQSPTWTFLIPAVLAAILAALVLVISLAGPFTIGGVEWGYRTGILGSALATVAASAAWAFVLARALTAQRGPTTRRYVTETVAGLSLLTLMGGAGLAIAQFASWAGSGFGAQSIEATLPMMTIGALLVAVGGVSFFSALVLGLIRAGHPQ